MDNSEETVLMCLVMSEGIPFSQLKARGLGLDFSTKSFVEEMMYGNGISVQELKRGTIFDERFFPHPPPISSKNTSSSSSNMEKEKEKKKGKEEEDRDARELFAELKMPDSKKETELKMPHERKKLEALIEEGVQKALKSFEDERNIYNGERSPCAQPPISSSKNASSNIMMMGKEKEEWGELFAELNMPLGRKKLEELIEEGVQTSEQEALKSSFEEKNIYGGELCASPPHPLPISSSTATEKGKGKGEEKEGMSWPPDFLPKTFKPWKNRPENCPPDWPWNNRSRFDNWDFDWEYAREMFGPLDKVHDEHTLKERKELFGDIDEMPNLGEKQMYKLKNKRLKEIAIKEKQKVQKFQQEQYNRRRTPPTALG